MIFLTSPMLNNVLQWKPSLISDSVISRKGFLILIWLPVWTSQNMLLLHLCLVYSQIPPKSL